MRSPSACSCSTARSAPGCRARTSGPTTSAARRSRAATSTSCSPGPTSSREMHDEFFEVGVDAVETATFGAFPLVLNEYGIADKTYEINLAAAAHRPRGRRRLLHRRPPPLRGRLDRPRHQARRRSARSRFAELRDAYEVQVDGLLEGGVDVLLIETVLRPAPGARPRSSAPAGRWRAAGRAGARSGAGHGRDHRPHARRHRDRRRAHRARGDAPRRHRHQLRHRPGRDDRAPALPRRSTRARSDLVPAQRRAAVGRRRPHALRPHARRSSPTRHDRFVTEFGVNIVGGCCGTTPEHLAPVVERVRRPRAARARTPEYEPGCSSIYTPVPFHQDARVPGRSASAPTPTAPRSSATRCSTATGTPACRWPREQVKEGAHVLDVCVDYVGRDGAVDMDEIASRFATQAALPLVLDSTEPQVLEAGLQQHRRQGDPQLGQPRGRRAPGQAPRPRASRSPASTAPPSSASLIDEEGQARDAEWKLRVAPPHPRPRHRALRPRAHRPDLRRAHVPALDRRRRPAPRRHRDHRGDPAHQGRAARASSRCSACRTVSSASSPRPATCSTACSCTSAARPASTPPSCTRRASCRCTGSTSAQREVALDLDLRPPRATATTRSPSCSALFEGVEAGDGREGGPLRLAGRGAAQAPHHRRRPRRPRGRPRRAARRRIAALAIVNDVLLDGMKVVGELFGSRRDAAAVRAAVAETMKAAVAYLEPHMEKADAGGKGTHRARHREGRRPRHRQEPRRHHPHQQRLRGAQPRHQGRRSPR